MIRAGELSKTIDIQAPGKTSDGMGGMTTVWTTLAANVYAAIWPVSASEMVQANAASMVLSHRIRIRYRSIFKAAWRLKYGDRYFNIVSIINPNEANEYLDLMCKEAA